MRLVLLGPPGAGKGTQAVRLSAALGVPAVSTGDIFRSNIADGTDLGRQVTAYLDAGALVPDSLTNALVRDRLAGADAAAGFVLDGYPRTVAQVAELDEILAAGGVGLDAVPELVVDPEELVRRLLARGQGRSDDTEDVIRHRMHVYAQETAQLADVYRDRGLLRVVDGTGTVDEVAQRLLAAARADGA